MGWKPKEAEVRPECLCIIARTDCDVARVTIDMLPDVALLEIFDFYLGNGTRVQAVQAWHKLVHVCRQWRNVVFGSPQRLNLRLRCTENTPVRETIDAWPLLPILVEGYGYDKYRMENFFVELEHNARISPDFNDTPAMPSPFLVEGHGYNTWRLDNILAALEHNDRIRELDFYDPPSSDMDKVLAAMHQSFTALTRLYLHSKDETVPVAPASFLGGSAPRLQKLYLDSISFSGLPKLLLSATHLVKLCLKNIPHSAYLSPEAMVAALAVLTRLELLLIGFKSPRSLPDRKTRRPPPPARTVLPALKGFGFSGVSEYLDDLVARIDAPLLDRLKIFFFHQLIFDTPQLTQFIRRTPKFKTYDKARLEFSGSRVWATTIDRAFGLTIKCTQSDWQLSSLAQVCSSGFMLAVEHLYICEQKYALLSWQDDIETSQWLEVLHPLTAVKELYISRKFTPYIVPTLQKLVGGRVSEVLPALQTLFLEEALPPGLVQESIGKFVAARQLAGRPIAVSRWSYC